MFAVKSSVKSSWAKLRKKTSGANMKRYSYILWLMLLIGFDLLSQVNTLGHPYEPVVIKGAVLSAFSNIAFDDLFLYRFNTASQSWEQIPYQFDDVGADESYFSENNGLLDGDDELAFMAMDVGDLAPAGAWISDSDSRNYPRYEIMISDGANNLLRGWVYLYRSGSLNQQFTTDYVAADPFNDGIISEAYELRHNSHGAVDYLRITATGGGNNIDIVDREKVRILGTIFGFPYQLNEDAISISNLLFKDGPVRVLRQVTYSLSSLGASYEKDVSERYYARLSITGGSIGHIDPSYGVTYMRQSLDLNSAANGMLFYNALNNGISIDGIPDAPNTTLPTAGVTWNQITGLQGTIVQIVNLPNLGNPQYLYYRDQAGGGTSDGTLETGDMASYGDIGISFQSPNTGVFALGFWRYYLPGNLAASVGAELAAHYETPMQSTPLVQQPPMNHQIAFQIVNPRIDGNLFVWDVEINRLDDWGSGLDAVLGDVQLYFNVNTAGFFPNAPTISNLNNNIQGNVNYNITSGRAGSSGEYAYIQIDYSDAGGSNWYPERNVWQPLLTASLPVIDFDQTSGLTWRTDAVFAAQGSGLALTVSTEGDGEINLPVELTLFTAQVENGFVKLEWVTASENENLGFYIYRSVDEKGHYDRITSSILPGAGTTTSQHRYSYTDQHVQPGQTYYYKLADVDFRGRVNMHGPIAVTVEIPQNFSLEQNYPNPFNASTRVRFFVGRSGPVKLAIFDIRGRMVRSLIDNSMNMGQHEIAFDGLDEYGVPLPSGVYFYRLEAEGFRESKRMQVLR